MQIIRFLDERGGVHYGEQISDNHANVLQGGISQGFSSTNDEANIAQLLAPVEPTAIVCIGLNYRAHAQETGADIPKQPVVFMKYPSAVNHPDSDIVIPTCCQTPPEVDYEVELAAIIGTAVKDVSVENALDHVFAYTIANDISARRWQKHGGGKQWIKGKSFDGFCPLGPRMVTVDELANPQDLEISLTLNGNTMQSANTSDMIFSIAEIISHLSNGTTLLPGTVILTGTPSGVGFSRTPPVFLRHGDKLVLEVEGLGRLSNQVVYE